MSSPDAQHDLPSRVGAPSRALLYGLAIEALFELMLASLLTRLPERWYFKLYRLAASDWPAGAPGRDGPGAQAVRAHPAAAQRAGPIGRVVGRVAKLMPFRSVCLQQALATHQMLRRRGARSVVVFGILPAQTTAATEADRAPARSAPYAAHAWVEVGEMIANGARHDLDRYTVVGRYE